MTDSHIYYAVLGGVELLVFYLLLLSIIAVADDKRWLFVTVGCIAFGYWAASDQQRHRIEQEIALAHNWKPQEILDAECSHPILESSVRGTDTYSFKKCCACEKEFFISRPQRERHD